MRKIILHPQAVGRILALCITACSDGEAQNLPGAGESSGRVEARVLGEEVSLEAEDALSSARASARLEDHPASVEHARAGLEACAQHHPLHHELGWALARQERFEQSRQVFSRAIEWWPDCPDCAWALCWNSLEAGDWERYLSLWPGHWSPLVFETMDSPETDRTELAYLVARRRVREHPESEVAHWLLGNALKSAGNAEPARLEYEKARGLSPAFAPAAYSLARLLDDAGRPEERRDLLESAATSWAGWGLPQSALAETLDDGGMHGSAVEASTAAIERYRRSAGCGSVRGREILRRGHYRHAAGDLVGAMEDLEEGVRQWGLLTAFDPHRYSVGHRVAVFEGPLDPYELYYAVSTQVALGEDDWTQSMDFAAQWATMQKWFGYSDDDIIGAPDWEDAFGALLLKREPEWVPAWQLMAALAAEDGDCPRALELYRKAALLAPGDPRLLLECADRSFHEERNLFRAREDAEAALRIDPDHGPTLILMAELELLEEAPEQAVVHATRALHRYSMAPREVLHQAKALALRGAARRILGDEVGAQRDFEASLGLGGCAESFLARGLERLAQGDLDGREDLARARSKAFARERCAQRVEEAIRPYLCQHCGGQGVVVQWIRGYEIRDDCTRCRTTGWEPRSSGKEGR